MLARLLKSKLALGAAAVVTGAVLLGGVALASFASTSPFATSAAIAPSMGEAPLAEPGTGDRLSAILDTLVQNGTITAEQKDKILAAIRDAAQQGKGRRPQALLGNLLEDATKVIGIDQAQLKKELPGKSLAQVAQAHGVSRDTLLQKLNAAATARIDKALADGKLTKDQADKLKASAGDAIARFVDRTWPTGTGGLGARGDKGLGALLQGSAKAIGISVDQLKRELLGKSIAQVAQVHGVSRDVLVQRMTASAQGRLADLIAKFVDRVMPVR